MGVKYITDQGPDGLSVGYNTSDLVSFYGCTPIAQRSGAVQAKVLTTGITQIVTTIALSTNPYGFATAAQGTALITAINAVIVRQELITVLVNELRAALIPTTGVGVIAGA